MPRICAHSTSYSSSASRLVRSPVAIILPGAECLLETLPLRSRVALVFLIPKNVKGMALHLVHYGTSTYEYARVLIREISVTC